MQTPERYAVIYLSLQAAAAQTQSGFYQAVTRSLSTHPAVQTRPALVSLLDQNQANGRFFAEIMQGFQQQQLLPVLCLDEFEALFQDPVQFNDDFYDALRKLMDDNALMLIAASRKPLDHYSRRHRLTSAFFNLGHVHHLTELTAGEAADLVRLPAGVVDGAAAALSLEEQRLARRWGGRHPYLLQLAARFLCEARQEGRDVAWARGRFKAEAGRLPRPGLRLRRLWPFLRRLTWALPARLGRLARGAAFSFTTAGVRIGSLSEPGETKKGGA